jgi:hypothetical protein
MKNCDKAELESQKSHLCRIEAVRVTDAATHGGISYGRSWKELGLQVDSQERYNSSGKISTRVHAERRDAASEYMSTKT